jgi:hypothetical protein
MSKTETFKQRYDALSAQTDEMQKDAAERRFEVKFEDRTQIKTLMEHLNKGYTWKTQNAAVIVSLYDQLKKQTKEMLASEETTESYVIGLRGHELNGLYQALLNVEGQGVEAARRFITMLTNIGEAVGTAMQELTDLNSQINDAHAELANLDQHIQVYGPDATYEEVEKMEASKSGNVANEVEPELEAEA